MVTAAIGSWAIGYLASRIFKTPSLVLRVPLFFVVGLLAVVASLGPAVYFISVLMEVPVEEHGIFAASLMIQICGLIYAAVVYLAFRLGLGRLAGSG